VQILHTWLADQVQKCAEANLLILKPFSAIRWLDTDPVRELALHLH